MLSRSLFWYEYHVGRILDFQALGVSIHMSFRAGCRIMKIWKALSDGLGSVTLGPKNVVLLL